MDEDIRIRQARMCDLKDVYLIEVNSFPYPYTIEVFITFLVLYPQYFLVAESGGNVVGYIIGSVDSDGSGHVVSIAIHPMYRRRGIGKKLLLTLEELMRSNGIRRIKLEVSVNNEPAISLYKLMGYRIVDIIRNYYPDGSDAYVMVKELSD